jgi:hypothetical protein
MSWVVAVAGSGEMSPAAITTGSAGCASAAAEVGWGKVSRPAATARASRRKPEPLGDDLLLK